MSSWLDRWPLGRAARGAAVGYRRHATAQLAAAVSYRMLFSLVPLVAFVVSVADLLLPDEQRNAVARWLAEAVPGRALDRSIQQALDTSDTTATIAGLVSLAVLLWAASGLMAALRIAFRLIWENDLRRTYVRSKLLDFAFVLGVGLVAVAGLGATLLVDALEQLGSGLRRAVGVDTQGQVLAVVAEVLASTALTFGILLVLYRTLPPVAPRLRALWLPALLAAISFHVATAAYAAYLARYGDVAATYGPLGAVLGFLLVVYVGITVVLLGAELVAAWPERPLERRAAPGRFIPPG
jgi:membrane protein